MYLNVYDINSIIVEVEVPVVLPGRQLLGEDLVRRGHGARL